MSTPEERAAAVLRSLSLLDEAAMQATIAAAIREAVDAETEACAAVCDKYAEWDDMPLDAFARAIRQRSGGFAPARHCLQNETD
jgi:hypothetical protein